jgi:hypothetical protein
MHILKSHKISVYVQMSGYHGFKFSAKKFPKGKIWIFNNT